MPTITQSPLDVNLAQIAQHNADLVELLREAPAEPQSIEFMPSAQGALAATLGGRQLCSRHNPMDEAARLADGVDLVEHAVVVVLGFGLGYHVQRLAARLGKAGIILVFEPDIALLRAVFERIDHSDWLSKSIVVFITDPSDRAQLSTKLHNCEAILAQGVTFLGHPASQARLGESSAKFSKLLTDHVGTSQVTMMTTLTRTSDTVRNLLLNFDHYAGGPGVPDLKDAAKGFPAILVSAGPSLQRNVHLLAQPGVRDCCVIIAVQTVLKPLLAAGIKPHFVTALDFHELSKRFYEGLRAEDVADVTLIVEPKVHPGVLDLFPGRSRCIASAFLDKMMGGHARDMGQLPPGSTVAHLSLQVARHLGCDPIAMIGQDLGFPDGLYYASGNAVHDVWAPELNPFNTIEMMEWQRIRRFRVHLHKAVDVHGKTIYSDAQMATYLQQFERDFLACKREGVTIIDATEGGVAKQHVTTMPLKQVIETNATREIPQLPVPPDETAADRKRMESSRQRIAEVRRDIVALRDASRKTATILREMLEHQRDFARMDQQFKNIERMKKQVEQRMASFELLNHINQLGMFRRLKADRRLTMARDLSPMARQRAEIERDLDNVAWLAEAAGEMIEQLLAAERVLEKRQNVETSKSRKRASQPVRKSAAAKCARVGVWTVGRSEVSTRVAALVAVDAERCGLGVERSLAEEFFGRTVLQATLERLGRCRLLDEIILIVPRGFDAERLIDRTKIGVTLDIERCDGSPFGPEHRAIAAARLWSDTCWRGGISGMSAYDEALAPQVMSAIMEKRGITAAIVAASDSPLIDVSPESGCDAVIARHLENPESRSIVFTQHPPGLGACLVSRGLMADLAKRNRLATIGARLVYQPHLPQADPITTSANVQIDHRVRNSLVRATFDTPRNRLVVREALRGRDVDSLTTAEIVAAIESRMTQQPSAMPQHVILELTTERVIAGMLTRRFSSAARASGPRAASPGRDSRATGASHSLYRPPLHRPLADRIFEHMAVDSDAVVTLGGAGDPLLHPEFDAIIASAREAGVRGIHVRTELRCHREVLDRLLASSVDVVSVDLHADRAATYETMMGRDEFKDVLMNIEYLVENRERLTNNSGAAAIALPWIVPRLQRRVETYEDIESFFDRWQHVLGTAVIEGVPECPAAEWDESDSLLKPRPPARVIHRELDRRMMILSNGDVPVSEIDLRGEDCVGNVAERETASLWSDLVRRRRALRESEHAPGAMHP